MYSNIISRFFSVVNSSLIDFDTNFARFNINTNERKRGLTVGVF